MKFVVSCLVIAALVLIAWAMIAPTPVAAPSSVVTPAPAGPGNQPAVIPVFVAGVGGGIRKGIVLGLPQVLSVTNHRGGEVEFDYTISNSLLDDLFVETQPVLPIAFSYSDESGLNESGGGIVSLGPHGRRFAVLSGNPYRDKGMGTCCSIVSRKGCVTIPAGAKAGGKFRVTIYVHGYYLKTGQPFSGDVEATIKLAD